MSLSSKALLNCKTLFFNPQHYCTQAQRSCHGVTVWNVTAMLLDGTKLNGRPGSPKPCYGGRVPRGPRVRQEARQLLPLSSRSPQPSRSGTQPVQKKARLETTSDQGSGTVFLRKVTLAEKRKTKDDICVFSLFQTY